MKNGPLLLQILDVDDNINFASHHYFFQKPGDACIGGTGDYATIHITPEPEFSYVSYETNVARDNYQDLIRNVVDTFKPGKFIITFYASRVNAF